MVKSQPAIFTFTPNPCIDKNVEVPVLVPDRKLHCTITNQQPGGGGINVARVIKRLGDVVTALFPAGGPTGELLCDLLEQEGVVASVVKCHSPTRENIIVTEKSSQKQYRLGIPGEPLSKEEWTWCEEKLKATNSIRYLVVSGSLPDQAPTDIYKILAGIAREKQARLVVDAAGTSLKMALQAGAWMIKPNLSELASLAGKEELNEWQAVQEARRLIRERSCCIVVISMDARGAILVSEKECYRAIPPVIKPKSSVGAGDSMVGGLIHSFSQGQGLQEVLRMGVACGTAAIMNPGTTLCKAEDVWQILDLVRLYPIGLTENAAI